VISIILQYFMANEMYLHHLLFVGENRINKYKNIWKMFFSSPINNPNINDVLYTGVLLVVYLVIWTI